MFDIQFFVGLVLGFIVGGAVFNKEFRRRLSRMLSKSQRRTTTTGYTPPRPPAQQLHNPAERIVYVRPGGRHFHNRRCSMLSGEQFEELGYYPTILNEKLREYFKPCSCTGEQ